MTHLRESVAELISSIQSNRVVPKYQFERASEPFLAMFLAEALETAGYGRLEYLAPEFPLKKRGSSQSTNVDHTLKSENGDWLLVWQLTAPLFLSKPGGLSRAWRNE